MANTSRFQMLIDIDAENDDSLLTAWTLPVNLKNKLSLNCKKMKMIDWNEREYDARVERTPGLQFMVCGAEWQKFVSDNIDPTIKKLCFRHIRTNTFQVMCFDLHGLEYIEDQNGNLVINRCLIETSHETLAKEFPANCFLDNLNVEVPKDHRRVGPPLVKPDKRAKILGSRQNGDVNVVYDWANSSNEWKTVGFEGLMWTHLCMENNVFEDNTIMFSKTKDDDHFTLDVFNSDDIGLGVAGNNPIRPDSKQWLSAETYVPEISVISELLHHCRVRFHKHKVTAPHFYKVFNHCNFIRKTMTIPTEFVRDNHLTSYKTAIIHFGDLHFGAQLEIKHDDRIRGEQNHMVMLAKWKEIAEEMGIVEGNSMQFQMNVDKCSADDQYLDIDVC